MFSFWFKSLASHPSSWSMVPAVVLPTKAAGIPFTRLASFQWSVMIRSKTWSWSGSRIRRLIADRPEDRCCPSPGSKAIRKYTERYKMIRYDVKYWRNMLFRGRYMMSWKTYTCITWMLQHVVKEGSQIKHTIVKCCLGSIPNHFMKTSKENSQHLYTLNEYCFRKMIFKIYRLDDHLGRQSNPSG